MGKRKINNINKISNKVIAVALVEPVLEEQKSVCIFCIQLVKLLQEKVSTIYTGIKVTPDNWSILTLPK